MPDGEGAETAYLDPAAPRKCFAYRLEDGFNNALVVAMLEMWVQLCRPSRQFDFVMVDPRVAAHLVNPADVRG
jgi:hypothetical protein